MRFSFFLFLFIAVSQLTAQVPALYSMHSQWDDKLTQWTILTVDEDVEGEMKMTWEALNRIDQWDISFEGLHGNIRMKKLGNKEQWELRLGNDVITILQQWAGDLREWRITDNSRSIDYKMPDRSDPYFWELRQSDRFGKFQVYTERDGDPRDWVIIDELSDDISLALKMAMVFVPIIPMLPR